MDVGGNLRVSSMRQYVVRMRSERFGRPCAKVLALAVLASMIVGCASSVHRPAVGASTPAATHSSTGRATRPVAHLVRVRVILDRPVVPAGTSIRGYALVTNATGRPVMIPDACNGLLLVGLTDGRDTYAPAVGGVGCKSSQLREGVTRIAVTVATTYQQCQGPGSRPTRTLPACAGPNHDVMPPLPAGRYKTAVVPVSLANTPIASAPVTVRLTSRPR